MTSDESFESDALLKLLTDALRAGPGSPEWQEAVTRVRAEGASGDEYAQLLAARENLASGREYREVKPGPRFDHKVLTAIEDEATRPKRPPLPLATLIAGLSIVAVVAVLIGGGYAIWRSRASDAGRSGQLGEVYFTREVVATTFTSPPPVPWRTVGVLPLAFNAENPRGMKVAPDAELTEAFQAGGVTFDEAMSADEPVEVEVVLRLQDPTASDIVQIFVTDDATTGGGDGTTLHELVWLLRGRASTVVLPSGRVAGEGEPLAENARDVRVRIMFDATEVIVQAGDQRLYSGPHELDPNKPRRIGIRLLARRDELAAKVDEATTQPSPEQRAVAVQSARIRKPRS